MEENAIFYYKNELLKLTDADYFARPELNFSKFKNFIVSGKNYEAKLEEEEKVTDSLLFGSVCHANLLDQDELKKYKSIPQLDRRTKAGKEEYEKYTKEAEEKGLTLVDETIYNQATTINLTPVVTNLLNLEGNVTERTVLWDYKSLNCKSKIDIYNEEQGILIDVKTTRDLPSFEKTINQSRYYLQLAFYQLALEACNKPVYSWKIIAIENQAPFDNTVFNFSKDYIEFAISHLKAKLDLFIFEKEISGFKGLSEEQEVNVSLPTYLF